MGNMKTIISNLWMNRYVKYTIWGYLTSLILFCIIFAGQPLDVRITSSRIFRYYQGALPFIQIAYTTSYPYHSELVITKHPPQCYVQFMDSRKNSIPGGFNITAFFVVDCGNAKMTTNLKCEVAVIEKNTKNIITSTNITLIRTINLFAFPSQIWTSHKQWNTSIESIMAHIPNTDVWRERKYNTCAVVGKGGSLYGSKLGNKIDSHDMVMRLDYHPVIPFEEDVGTKFDVGLISWVAPQLQECWRWNNSLVVQHPAIIITYSILGLINALPSCQLEYPETRNFFFNNLFNEILSQMLKNSFAPEELNNATIMYPTSEIRGVFAAAQVCQKVTLYGFWNGMQRTFYPQDNLWKRKNSPSEERIFEKLKNGFKDFLGYHNPFDVPEEFQLEYGEDYQLRKMFNETAV